MLQRIEKLTFTDLSRVEVGLENDAFFLCFWSEIVCYVNTMTFESILGVFLVKTGILQRIKN